MTQPQVLDHRQSQRIYITNTDANHRATGDGRNHDPRSSVSTVASSSHHSPSPPVRDRYVASISSMRPWTSSPVPLMTMRPRCITYTRSAMSERLADVLLDEEHAGRPLGRDPAHGLRAAA